MSLEVVGRWHCCARPSARGYQRPATILGTPRLAHPRSSESTQGHCRSLKPQKADINRSQSEVLAEPRLSRALTIFREARLGASCSQTLTTFQPAVLRSRSVSRSRSTVRVSFWTHHSLLAFGSEPCLGQRCQKQPSTKTATCDFVNTMSARRRIPAIGA